MVSKMFSLFILSDMMFRINFHIWDKLKPPTQIFWSARLVLMPWSVQKWRSWNEVLKGYQALDLEDCCLEGGRKMACRTMLQGPGVNMWINGSRETLEKAVVLSFDPLNLDLGWFRVVPINVPISYHIYPYPWLEVLELLQPADETQDVMEEKDGPKEKWRTVALDQQTCGDRTDRFISYPFQFSLKIGLQMIMDVWMFIYNHINWTN